MPGTICTLAIKAHMETFNNEIDQFFHDYTEHFNNALEGKEPAPDRVKNSYSGQILQSSPDKLSVYSNDQMCMDNIPRGLEFYKSIGTTCMVIDNKEITQLDDNHALAKVHWKANYDEGKTGEMIGFNIFYLLRRENDSWQCFATMEGDEQKALKEHGLI